MGQICIQSVAEGKKQFLGLFSCFGPLFSLIFFKCSNGGLLRGWGLGGGRYVPTIFLLRIPSACESVYREIFVRRRETVRLPSKL